MIKLILKGTSMILICCISLCNALGQSNCLPEIPFVLDSNKSASYIEMFGFFHQAGKCAENMKFMDFGESDIGEPLSVMIIDNTKEFQPPDADDDRCVVLINNGIHPGEPCGIDASMLLVRDILEKGELSAQLEDVIVLIVPIYNIGGSINRSSTSRVNQNGPAFYGFRGNAKNLDLNRDFIKSDSRNAQSMAKLFNAWNPDVFLDTHTTNGADYTYTMTFIANMKDRLMPSMQELIHEHMLPNLYEGMNKAGWEMSPYVYARTTPDKGIAAFNDLPRYSMGYGALHHIPSFTSEAHMFKPFKDRVMSTYRLIHLMIDYASKHGKRIKQARIESRKEYSNLVEAPLAWELDTNRHTMIEFKGYKPTYQTSEVTGLQRLRYERDSVYRWKIRYFDRYRTTLAVDIPVAYVLPQAYTDIAQRLRANGVKMQRVRVDSTAHSRSYRIVSYETSRRAYEGHYFHTNVEVKVEKQSYNLRAGDYYISTDQKARRFIVETLEPQAPDSYFTWNFFDGILMQKEYFSPYVFEDVAQKLLEENPELKREFQLKKEEDNSFANSAWEQLDFIYKNSEYYEKTHNLYPVGRLFE